MIKYSVVIPTFNGENRILNTLDSLLRQSIPPNLFEIIVIDDGSRDNTWKYIVRFIRNNPDRKIVLRRQSNQGCAAARNHGIRIAKGDIVFFTDDDCEVPALWMEKMLKVYEKFPEIVGVGGWLQPPLSLVKKNIYHQFIYFRNRQSWGFGVDFFEGMTGEYPAIMNNYKEFSLPAVNGGNISFKKWVLLNVGGFNPVFKGAGGYEDVELSYRIQASGYKLYYLPIYVVDRKKINLKSFIKFSLKRGDGMKTYFKLYGICHSPSILRMFNEFKFFYRQITNDYKSYNTSKKIYLIALIHFILINLKIKIS